MSVRYYIVSLFASIRFFELKKLICFYMSNMSFFVSWGKQNIFSVHDLPPLKSLCLYKSLNSLCINVSVTRPCSPPIELLSLIPCNYHNFPNHFLKWFRIIKVFFYCLVLLSRLSNSCKEYVKVSVTCIPVKNIVTFFNLTAFYQLNQNASRIRSFIIFIRRNVSSASYC